MNKKETHNYKISVVMPLYNVADYLEKIRICYDKLSKKDAIID